MKLFLPLLALLAIVSTTALADPAPPPAVEVPPDSVQSDGKAAFQTLGCTACHSASAAGVLAPEGAQAGRLDLPGQGATYEAAWLQSYLTKQQTITGRQHPTRVAGEPAQQQALMTWLAALSSPTP